VVEDAIPDCLMLANGQWIDWLVANNEPESNRKFLSGNDKEN
jgi:hypothetical protein